MKKVEKASFKRSAGKHRVKGKGHPIPENPELKYGGYNLEKLPQEARPDMEKRNLGKHSYTLSFGGTIEVLLSKEAFYVKKVGQQAQVLLGRLAGPKMAVQQLHLNLRKQELGLNVLLAHRRLITRGDCSFDFSKNYHIKVSSCFVDCLGVLEQERF